jgi:hypothetical protein
MISHIGLVLVLIFVGLNATNSTLDCPIIDGNATGYDLVYRPYCNDLNWDFR